MVATVDVTAKPEGSLINSSAFLQKMLRLSKSKSAMSIVEPNINLKRFISSQPAKVIVTVEGKVRVRRNARIAQASLSCFLMSQYAYLSSPKRVDPYNIDYCVST